MRNGSWVGRCSAVVAAAVVMAGGNVARADIASDQPAAIVIYPSVKVGRAGSGQDTVLRITNTNETNPILLHCFYLDTNSHCVGGPQDGEVCTGAQQICTGQSTCNSGWFERDFRIRLTASQPLEWTASAGLSSADSPSSADSLPLPTGVCAQNLTRPCGSDADCNPFPGGGCTQSNAGTDIPGVPEIPFTGELRCLAIDESDTPIGRNDVKGEGLIETSTRTGLDVASYNAIGLQATGADDGNRQKLVLGGSSAEYSGCPNAVIVDHFFDTTKDPIPGSSNTITTNLVLVTCTDDTLHQKAGKAVAQYLVFNEFEQRFSTSNSISGFKDTQLCKIDTRDCTRSVWNVATAGTLTGQTLVLPVSSGSAKSGLVGIAVEKHAGNSTRTAAFNLVYKGTRSVADTITIP